MVKLAVLVLLAGCSISATHYTGGGDDDDGPASEQLPFVAHSGTRLQVVDMTFTGGTRLPVAIRDSVLGVECGPLKWLDGATYCTPLHAQILYTNSTCTTPIVSPLPAADTSGPLFGIATQSASNAVTHLYRAGKRVDPPEIFYDAGGQCASTLANNVYEVVEEVPASQLVAITISTDDAGALSHRYVRGSDGYLGVTGATLHDNHLAIDCFVGVQGAGYPTMYCVPQSGSESVFTSQYSDPACTRPIVGSIGGSAPRYAVPFPKAGGCPLMSTAYAVGAPISPAQVYSSDAGTGACTGNPASPGMYYDTGEAFALPPLVHQPFGGSDARITNALRVAGSQRFLDRDFYDRDLATWCATKELPDGTHACLPSGGSITSAFDDPACTHAIPVAAFYEPYRQCGVSLAPYARDSAGSSVQIRPIVATPIQVYEATPSCTPANPSRVTHYPVGDPLPLAMFATATIVTEPTR